MMSHGGRRPPAPSFWRWFLRRPCGASGRRTWRWPGRSGACFSVAFLRGGFAGLPAVAADQWGGLAITLILSLSVAAVSLPWGIALALGRQSSVHPILSRACIAYVEFIRSIPLVSLFFMGIVLFPILIPSGLGLGQIGRAFIILTVFYGVYVPKPCAAIFKASTAVRRRPRSRSAYATGRERCSSSCRR